MPGSYYSNTIGDFLIESTDSIVGKLNIGGTEFAHHWTMQTTSWKDSIDILKNSFTELLQTLPEAYSWFVLFEYTIPRIGKRMDVALLARDIIFVIEFKHDRNVYAIEDIRQAERYCVDLKDFHKESQGRIIVPVILAPLAKDDFSELSLNSNNLVQKTLKANQSSLGNILNDAYVRYSNLAVDAIDGKKWNESEYHPTPTIIQAAQALFSGQSVREISRSSAEAENLSITTDLLVEEIQKAKENNQKIICFVTGVPGAGKTLVGLNLVHKHELYELGQKPAAYFSGNGPLVSVLKEALANDYKENAKRNSWKTQTDNSIKVSIQNLHTYIKQEAKSNKAPEEKIVVFDEAQRCWDATHFYNKGRQNQNRQPDSIITKKSEPELLFEIMDRHDKWAAIIALVGGGQEINTGEAGIREWGNVIAQKYSHWKVFISPQLLTGDSSTAGNTLFASLPQNVSIQQSEKLHLTTSQRFLRSNKVNDWVNAVIEGNADEANKIYPAIGNGFEIVLTRSLQKAKDWLRDRIQGDKRVGLVASSGAVRLRPEGISVKEIEDVPKWFLNPENDIRSSYYLEVAATEYKIQGLELDWVGLCWDLDFSISNNKWTYNRFDVTRNRWATFKNDDKGDIKKQYLKNKYRVLLTRSREGFIIWIPAGDPADTTRKPVRYDALATFLKSCGVREV